MFSAAQIASSNIQNISGARVSTPRAIVNCARANNPMPQTSIAEVRIMTADNPSARNATPSGGAHPPIKYCNVFWVCQMWAAITTATANSGPA